MIDGILLPHINTTGLLDIGVVAFPMDKYRVPATDIPVAIKVKLYIPGASDANENPLAIAVQEEDALQETTPVCALDNTGPFVATTYQIAAPSYCRDT